MLKLRVTAARMNPNRDALKQVPQLWEEVLRQGVAGSNPVSPTASGPGFHGIPGLKGFGDLIHPSLSHHFERSDAGGPTPVLRLLRVASRPVGLNRALPLQARTSGDPQYTVISRRGGDVR